MQLHVHILHDAVSSIAVVKYAPLPMVHVTFSFCCKLVVCGMWYMYVVVVLYMYGLLVMGLNARDELRVCICLSPCSIFHYKDTS